MFKDAVDYNRGPLQNGLFREQSASNAFQFGDGELGYLSVKDLRCPPNKTPD
jgi:hypothetical protein